MNAYDVPSAVKPILPFVDDLSNWYVRRSRRRFWKSDDNADKSSAYTTLHYVLVTLAHIIAPFTPFLAEELYRNLTGGESVHLNDWPKTGHIQELSIETMARTRSIIEQGLALRMQKGENEESIKIRQPLAKLEYPGEKLGDSLEQIVAEEVNVKQVLNYGDSVVLDKSITPGLRREGYMREVVRFVQEARKSAGLEVDDRIYLALNASGELGTAIKEFSSIILEETLALSNVQETLEDTMYAADVEVDGQPLHISLIKA